MAHLLNVGMYSLPNPACPHAKKKKKPQNKLIHLQFTNLLLIYSLPKGEITVEIFIYLELK